MDFEWTLFVESLPALARGAATTAELAFVSICGGLVLGLMGGLARVSGIAALNAFALFCVTLLRGVPLLVTMLFFYYGLPSLGLLLEAKTVAILRCR